MSGSWISRLFRRAAGDKAGVRPRPPRDRPEDPPVFYQPVPFFDYSGWDGAAEYLHPISPTKWLIAFGSFRRFVFQR